MRKIISLILLCSLLLLCFSGCSLPNSANGEKEQNQDKAPNTNDDKDNTSVINEGELDKSCDLVATLVAYLKQYHTEYDLPGTSTAIKIDEVKNGKQALHVGFNKSGYYFICAYYDNTHEDETTDYCCATNYTWVKFENANEISEKYKDLRFVVAFQINKASFVTDITNKDATVPNIEHFQKYVPDFNNGLNTNGAVAFDTSFIYLNSSDDGNVYHSISAYDNVLKTLPCVFLNEQYYITIELYTVYPDGSRSDGNITVDFGKYYDSLVNIMDTTGYSVTDEKGRTNFYGIIEISDFADCIKE